METNNQLAPLLADLDAVAQSMLLSHIDSCVLQLTRATKAETSPEDKAELEHDAFLEFAQVYGLFMQKIGVVPATQRIRELSELLGVQPGVRVKTAEKYESAGKFAPLRNVLKLSEEIQRELRKHLK